MRNPNTCCKICGKSIYRRPAQIAAGPVYCCRRCFGKDTLLPIVVCGICGKEMTGEKKFCSRACSNESRKGIAYKTGLDFRTTASRLKLLRGNSCQDCGYNKYPQILEVHHKIRKADGGTDDDDNLLVLCPNCHAIRHRVEALDIGASTGFENRHT